MQIHGMGWGCSSIVRVLTQQTQNPGFDPQRCRNGCSDVYLSPQHRGGGERKRNRCSRSCSATQWIRPAWATWDPVLKKKPKMSTAEHCLAHCVLPAFCTLSEDYSVSRKQTPKSDTPESSRQPPSVLHLVTVSPIHSELFSYFCVCLHPICRTAVLNLWVQCLQGSNNPFTGSADQIFWIPNSYNYIWIL